MIGDPESCPACVPDNGLPMWECHRSDNPESEDAMPCICLCHPLGIERKDERK